MVAVVVYQFTADDEFVFGIVLGDKALIYVREHQHQTVLVVTEKDLYRNGLAVLVIDRELVRVSLLCRVGIERLAEHELDAQVLHGRVRLAVFRV